MMTVCARSKCNNVFYPTSRLCKGELVWIVSCPKCRGRTAQYMKRYRATAAGKIAKHRQNASNSALQSVRRYNASEVGKARTALQSALRKRARELARAENVKLSQNAVADADATQDSGSEEDTQEVISDELRDSNGAERSESAVEGQ